MVRPRLQLFIASFLLLFVELGLIRLTAAEVVYLSYFTNFVLLGSFLGIGIGFLRARSQRDLFPFAPMALAGIVLLVILLPAGARLSTSEAHYYQSPGATGLPIWIMLPLVFLLVAAVMEMIAEGVASRFAALPNLDAYRWDILGALAGVGLFTALAFLDLPPLVWGVVVALVFGGLGVVPQARLEPSVAFVQVLALVVMLGGLVWEAARPDTFWSPYHKIELAALNGVTQVRINGTPSQVIQSVDQIKLQSAFFFRPYELMTSKEPPGNVLVIGAGTGSDTAVALSQGARHVDAVEIDPRLAQLGRGRNPDHPYEDARVDLHVTDGRAFLEDTDRVYDLILFALPDSVALVAGQSSLRLESYLFTQEAVRQAKDHLAPDGVLSMSNYFRDPWVIDRLAGEMQDTFGHAPCLNVEGEGGHLAQLTISPSPATVSCPDNLWTPSGSVPSPATDDHPFSFIRGRTIPGFYLLTIALILLVSLGAVGWTTGSPNRLFPYADLFFMGAGFLLLETRSIVTFSLLFGTTWLVNAFVFAGILIAVLAGIEVARHVRPRRPWIWYLCLLGGLAVVWVAPTSWLLGLPYAGRLPVAVVITFLPVLLANIVFADRFRDIGSSTTAFGANLLGAMVGGTLEYGAIVVGYRGLLVVAALLYGLAFLAGRSHLVRTEPAAAALKVRQSAGRPRTAGGNRSLDRGRTAPNRKRKR